jgi:hypothetical protein
MAFQPFTSFGTFAKAVLPNASNSATVTIPSSTGAAGADTSAVSTPVAPVTPTTPVLASGPTKPITGIVVAPVVDTALRGVHSTWEAALAGILVLVLLPLIGVKLGTAGVVTLTALLTGAAAVARSVLARKTGAKAVLKP